MLGEAEGEVPGIGRPGDVELVGPFPDLFVVVRGGVEHDEVVAPRDLLAAELGVVRARSGTCA